MILNLMRVEKLRVEEMMKRSFSEIGIQKNAFRYQKRLEMLGRQASSFPEVECTTCGPVIEEYYNACHEYVRHLKDVQVISNKLSVVDLCTKISSVLLSL